MGEHFSKDLISSASMVQLFHAKIRDDIPVSGNYQLAGGSLLLYSDRLEFQIQKGFGLMGGPAVGYAKQNVPQRFLLDDILRAQVDLRYLRGIEYQTLTLVMTDEKTYLFAPDLTRRKGSHSVKEMGRLCYYFKMFYGSWIPAPDLTKLYKEVEKAGKTLQKYENASLGTKGKGLSGHEKVSPGAKSIPMHIRRAQVRLREYPEQRVVLSLPADPAEPRNQINLPLNFAFSYDLQLPGIREKREIQFVLNKQTWTVHKSFRAAQLEKISEEYCIMQDAFGRKTLEVYEKVPIFDSEDAQYDSWRCHYLFTDGEEIHLLSSRGGYRIASASVYVHLKSASSELYPWLCKLNFPTDQIQWVK